MVRQATVLVGVATVSTVLLQLMIFVTDTLSSWGLGLRNTMHLNSLDVFIHKYRKVFFIGGASYCPGDRKESVSRSVVPDSLRPCGLQLPGSSVHGILQARIGWSELPFPSPDGDVKVTLKQEQKHCVKKWCFSVGYQLLYLLKQTKLLKTVQPFKWVGF